MSFAVEVAPAAQVAVEKIIEFLDSTPLAGSVVSKSGEVIHLTEKMSGMVGYNQEGKKFRCEWIGEKNDESCPDCAESVTLDGRCFVSRENRDVTLLAAIRIPQADNILVRVYSDFSKADRAQSERVIGKLLEFASPANQYRDGAAFSFSTEDGLVSVAMHDLVDSALRLPELAGLKAENRVEPDQVIESTIPIILRQMILNVLLEFRKLELVGPVSLKNMRQAGLIDDRASHLLSFQAKSSKSLGKSKSSELTAMGLRLKVFSRNIILATGFKIEAPIVFRENDLIEVQFSISNRLGKVAIDTSGDGNALYRNLSAREQEIVEMVRIGYDNMIISDQLGITHATVKQHLKAIYRKAGVKNRVELIFRDAPPTP